MGLFNSPMMEVAIGMVFLFFVLSLICSALGEMIAQAFNLRAEHLWSSIRALVHDLEGAGLAWQLYDHPVIQSLAVRRTTKPQDDDCHPADRPKPSFIANDAFSLAILDIVANDKPLKPEDEAPSAAAAEQAADANQLNNNVAALADRTFPASVEDLKNKLQADWGEEVQALLLPLLNSADNDIRKARQNIEVWYAQAMDRASGWYKARAKRILLFVGCLAVVLLNADSISIANSLWNSPTERSALIAEAEKATPPPQVVINPNTTPDTNANKNANNAAKSNADTNANASTNPGTDANASSDKSHDKSIQDILNSIPPSAQNLLGWNGPIRWDDPSYSPTDPHRFPSGFGEWLTKLLGLAITAYLVSFGAPFWFDLLNKLLALRQPEKQDKSLASPPPGGATETKGEAK